VKILCFILEYSKYFKLLENSPNNHTLAMSGDSIQEIYDKTNLMFSIIAEKPGSVDGAATIVINLSGILSLLYSVILL
jgi:hypothetical protein